jgi:ATP-dependent DNA helicase RecQ
LFEQLRALRSKLAAERGLPPYVIFHDRSLIEMATYYPRTPAELGQIYGVGQRKTEAYGPHFLPVIQAYCDQNDVQPVQKPPFTRFQHLSPSGRERTEYIWEQFQSGESIAAIAADTGFVQQTILNHLRKAFEAGRPLRLAGLEEASELSEAVEQRVIAAFDECGTEFLKPVFEALDGAVSYDQLHIWRLIYRVRRNGKAS